jgi:hypothetical protein
MDGTYGGLEGSARGDRMNETVFRRLLLFRPVTLDERIDGGDDMA